MRHFRTSIVVLTAGFMLIAAGCGDAKKPIPEAQIPENYTVYSNAQDWSMAYPKDWTEEVKSDGLTYFTEPKQEGKDQQTTVNVVAAPNQNEILSMDELAKAAADFVVTKGAIADSVQHDVAHLSGGDFARVSYKVEADGQELRGMQLGMYDDKDTLYVVTLVGDKDGYDKNLEAFNKMLETFRVKNPR